MNLENKNIILTGGSLGIGKETAKSLIDKGANVLITGRSKERLSKTFNHTNLRMMEFDIGDIDNISLNAKKCIEMLNNRVDVLINNAGIGVSKSVEELNINDFLNIFNVNVFGLSLFTKEIVPLMKEQKFIHESWSMSNTNQDNLYHT